MEAEYIALTSAEAIWLSKLELELGENKMNKAIKQKPCDFQNKVRKSK